MPEFCLQMLGQQQGGQGIDTHVLEKEGWIDLPDGLLGPGCRGVQKTRCIDQPVNFIHVLCPVANGVLIGEIQPVPVDFRMSAHRRIASAGGNNFLNLRAPGESLDECTAETARTACYHYLQGSIPEIRLDCAGVNDTACSSCHAATRPERMQAA